MDMCMNWNMFAISSGPWVSSDELMSQYSSYRAFDVQPPPHVVRTLSFLLVVNWCSSARCMACSPSLSLSFRASIWWLSCCILRTSILAIVQLRMPEIEDRYNDLLQQQKSNYMQRCVCACVCGCSCSLIKSSSTKDSDMLDFTSGGVVSFSDAWSCEKSLQILFLSQPRAFTLFFVSGVRSHDVCHMKWSRFEVMWPDRKGYLFVVSLEVCVHHCTWAVRWSHFDLIWHSAREYAGALRFAFEWCFKSLVIMITIKILLHSDPVHKFKRSFM